MGALCTLPPALARGQSPLATTVTLMPDLPCPAHLQSRCQRLCQTLRPHQSQHPNSARPPGRTAATRSAAAKLAMTVSRKTSTGQAADRVAHLASMPSIRLNTKLRGPVPAWVVLRQRRLQLQAPCHHQLLPRLPVLCLPQGHRLCPIQIRL